MLNKASSKGYGGWLRDSRVLLASQVTVKKGVLYTAFECTNLGCVHDFAMPSIGPLGLAGSGNVESIGTVLSKPTNSWTFIGP